MSDFQKLIVPKNVKAGFNRRGDTYSGKLAFLIRQGDGQWKSEKSWNKWIGNEFQPVEFENVPIEGFVLNKNVGGVRRSYGWNARNEYIRVYDPRGWEFEISVPNLLFILQESVCHPGKGLEGDFVYAWPAGSGKVVLLPCSSQDYTESQKFTKLQSKKLSARDLIKGATYRTKDNEDFVYIGYHHYIRTVNPTYSYFDMAVGSIRTAKQKRHIFWKEPRNKNNPFGYPEGFVPVSSINKFAMCLDENPVSNFAELVSMWYESPLGTPVRELTLVDWEPEDYNVESKYYAYEADGQFLRYKMAMKMNYCHNKPETSEYMILDQKPVKLTNGLLIIDTGRNSSYSYPPDFPENLKEGRRYYGDSEPTILPWNPPPNKQILVATLESGAKYRVNNFLEERIND